MIVIYAEKPAQGRSIAQALGITGNGSGFKQGKWKRGGTAEDAVVVWGFGHMCSLKHAPDYNPDYKTWSKIPLPFIPEEYELMPKKDPVKRAVDAGTSAQLAQIKKFLCQKGAEVICATDDDREGELIFAYVAEHLGFKGGYQRVQINSMTDDGIRKAFDDLKPGSAFKNKADAGRGRSIADWLVGINLTTAATLKYMRGKGQLSIGRVQTATLNMIVERELEIRNFISKPFFSVVAELSKTEDEKYLAQHKAERFDTEEEAQAIIDIITGQKATITEIKAKEKKYAPPILYSQTTLQMAANSHHGLTLQETLTAAQALYEKGFITYPRTGSQYLTEDMKDDTNKAVQNLGAMSDYAGYVGPLPKIEVRDFIFNNKKVESHYAIIPTGKIPSGLNHSEQKVFDLIAKSLIRLCYPDGAIKATTITHDIAGETFISKGSEITQVGWFVVDAMPKLNNKLPNGLVEGDELDGVYSIKQGKTEPPKRYTDKTLVSAMAAAGKTIKDTELRDILTDPTHCGIGTEATRAGIVETLKKRGYVSLKSKQYYAEDTGIELIKVFPIDDLKSPVMSAMWEKRLAEIERGNDTLSSFITDMEQATSNWCSQIMNDGSSSVVIGQNVTDEETIGVCPVCNSGIRMTDKGILCSSPKESDCKFAIWRNISGKQLTDKQLMSLLTYKETKEIKGFKSKRTGKTFSAKLILNEFYKMAFDFGETKAEESYETRGVPASYGTCPACGGELEFTDRGLRCSKRSETSCSFIVWRTVAGKELEDETLLELAREGKTETIDGFTSRKGKAFSAALILNEEGKVEFDFGK